MKACLEICATSVIFFIIMASFHITPSQILIPSIVMIYPFNSEKTVQPNRDTYHRQFLIILGAKDERASVIIFKIYL